jgi:hypothetical protein
VPLNIIQRQLGHANLGTTSIRDLPARRQEPRSGDEEGALEWRRLASPCPRQR